MRKAGLFLLMFQLIGISCAAEEVILTGGIKLAPILDQCEVFFRQVSDALVVESDLFVLIDQYGLIYRINYDERRLVNTISSKGEGPKELMIAKNMVERNGVLFVLDQGYGGIKKFRFDGEYLGSFKCDFRFEMTNMFSPVMAVNSNGDLIIASPNHKTGKLLAVYNAENGRKSGELISDENLLLKDRRNEAYHQSLRYAVAIDGEDNIFVMMHLKRILYKYDKRGQLLWEFRIEDQDERLKRNAKSKDIEFNKTGSVSYRTKVSGFAVGPQGYTYIRHCGGSLLVDPSGKMVGIIATPLAGLLRCHNGCLLSLMMLLIESDSANHYSLFKDVKY